MVKALSDAAIKGAIRIPDGFMVTQACVFQRDYAWVLTGCSISFGSRYTVEPVVYGLFCGASGDGVWVPPHTWSERGQSSKALDERFIDWIEETLENSPDELQGLERIAASMEAGTGLDPTLSSDAVAYANWLLDDRRRAFRSLDIGLQKLHIWMQSQPYSEVYAPKLARIELVNELMRSGDEEKLHQMMRERRDNWVKALKLPVPPKV